MNYKRNELGLLEGVEYEYNEDGSVNWRAMIGEEHLYPNKGWFERFNKPVPKTIEGLGDHQLLIKLSGIKELAKLRGFTRVHYDVIKCEIDHVSVKCEINWIPNFENPKNQSDFLPPSTSFEDLANATVHNTSSFAQKFLETIAANRAFVRCVRNFLNIHIVGADEIDTSDGKSPLVSSTNPERFNKLTLLMEKVNLSEDDFETFKDILRGLWKSGKYKNDNVSDWEEWEDIPKKEIMKLLQIV